jgi:cysteine desulfurase
MTKVYLDYAATAPLLPSVKQALLLDNFGNASSLHATGRAAKTAIEQARAQVARLIGAQPAEIIFTSGGSEANNMLIKSFDHVVASAIEHPSVLRPLQQVKRAVVVPVDRGGRVDMTALQRALGRRPKLVSIMLANNELGTLQDLPRIARLAHATGALVHTDATQAVGKILVDVDQLGVDYLTYSAHKIGGPKGAGTLYVRSGAPIKPLIDGGHQEDDRRAGTENTLAISGFGAAAAACTNRRLPSRRMLSLKQRLHDGIMATIPDVMINGDQQHCLPNILNLSFAGAEGESIMLALDAVGVAVSTGSACATRDITSSHVLTAIDADPELAHNSLRFSLGPETTTADIDYVLEVLPPIIKRLRQVSAIGSDS